MKAHLLIAHPEKTSFNFALHEMAVEVLTANGVNLTISDLYAESFTASASQSDVKGFPENESFNLAKAQRWGIEKDAFVADIKTEQDKLMSSDIVIMQFPLWWWSFPAILKGWVDRVLSSGFAYGNGATLMPKKVMYSITTGGASNEEELSYYKNKIDGLYQDVFGFIGWEVIPPFIAHGVQQITQQERFQILNDYREHLATHVVHAQQIETPTTD